MEVSIEAEHDRRCGLVEVARASSIEISAKTRRIQGIYEVARCLCKHNGEREEVFFIWQWIFCAGCVRVFHLHTLSHKGWKCKWNQIAMVLQSSIHLGRGLRTKELRHRTLWVDCYRPADEGHVIHISRSDFFMQTSCRGKMYLFSYSTHVEQGLCHFKTLLRLHNEIACVHFLFKLGILFLFQCSSIIRDPTLNYSLPALRRVRR